jgi:hypothetical protein
MTVYTLLYLAGFAGILLGMIGAYRETAATQPKDRCLHAEVVPVVSYGETLAHLCLTCDEQLPAEWASS